MESLENMFIFIKWYKKLYFKDPADAGALCTEKELPRVRCEYCMEAVTASEYCKYGRMLIEHIRI